jgi:hypothetical protein
MNENGEGKIPPLLPPPSLPASRQPPGRNLAYPLGGTGTIPAKFMEPGGHSSQASAQADKCLTKFLQILLS